MHVLTHDKIDDTRQEMNLNIHICPSRDVLTLTIMELVITDQNNYFTSFVNLSVIEFVKAY